VPHDNIYKEAHIF